MISASLNGKFCLRAVLIMSLVLSSAGCGKKDGDTTSASADTIADSVESAVTLIGGIADEQKGSGFAYLPMSRTERLLAEIEGWVPLRKAWASGACAASSRAVQHACAGSHRTNSALDCTLGNYTLSGWVDLQYSEADCALDAVGETVTRTYSVQVSGNGFLLNRFTNAHTTYDGQSLSGGGTLTYQGPASWQMTVGGNHRVLTRNGNTWFDISTKTGSAVSISGTLARGSRTVNGGSIQVIHNRAGFTATWVPSSVSWATVGCCYPTSGSATVTFTGSVTGSGTVSFGPTCGQMTIQKDGVSRTATLANCE